MDDGCEPPAAKRTCPDDEEGVNLKSSEAAQGNGDVAVNTEGGRFGKRRKFALLLSYCGKGYMGMQKNPGVPTIEEDLLEALCKASAFPPNMKNDLAKLKFQRCARTDKGVSAARQLVSIKMNLEDPVMLINTHLPPQIRVMAVRRVTKSFDSRYACGGRMYEYLMPTYAFAPYHLSTPDYRMPDATVEQVDRLLQGYVGTHNYHNFTAGKKYKDMSSNRYMISFKTGERFVTSSDEDPKRKPMEFISLRVRGQSFLLHQIRKMIGLVIAVVRGRLKEEEFGLAFQEGKFDIPKAPSLGLLLDDVFFDGYNRKFCNSGERDKLEWEELCPQIEEFKKGYIYRSILETEIKEMSMMQWLHTLQMHNFRETAERQGKQPQETADQPEAKVTEVKVQPEAQPEGSVQPTQTTDTVADAKSDTTDVAISTVSTTVQS